MIIFFFVYSFFVPSLYCVFHKYITDKYLELHHLLCQHLEHSNYILLPKMQYKHRLQEEMHVSNYLCSIVEIYILLTLDKQLSPPQKNWDINAIANNITTTTKMITPNIPKAPGEIVNITGVIAIRRSITIINPIKPSIIPLISGISIHRHLVTSLDLKHLWVSLSSKETFVFDTPGRDAHLPLFFSSVFYVCKSLNGERSIIDCHPHLLGSCVSPICEFFDVGGT
jgi:hypothetical protein